MVEILVAGVLMFGVPINGSLPLLLLLTGLFLVTTLGLGLFISTIANTQQEAMLTTYLLLAAFDLPVRVPVPAREPCPGTCRPSATSSRCAIS